MCGVSWGGWFCESDGRQAAEVAMIVFTVDADNKQTSVMFDPQAKRTNIPPEREKTRKEKNHTHQ